MGLPYGYFGLVFPLGITAGGKVSYGVAPSDVSNDDRAAQINAAIALVAASGGGYVRLYKGSYYLASAILLMSNVLLVGAGESETRLITLATFSGATLAAADTPTNAVIQAVGTPDLTKCNTTIVTGPLYENQFTFLVGSVGTLAANDYVRVSGNNTSLGAPGALESDGPSVLVYGLYKVGSVTGTQQLTLAGQAATHHAVGTTVVAYTPVVNAGVAQLHLDGTASPAVAVGILGRSTWNFSVEHVEGKGFSRTLVDLDQGTQRWRVEHLTSLGTLNGLLYLDSAHYGQAAQFTCDPTGARYHDAGTPRGLITLQNRPCGNQLAHLRLARCCWGIRHWGGEHNTFHDIHITDADPFTGGSLSGVNRAVAANEYQATTKLGVAIDGVAGPLTFVEIPVDAKWSEITIEDVVCDNAAGAFVASIWEHDTQGSSWKGLSILNRGIQFWSGRYTMNGLLARDVYDATFVDVRSYGCIYHFVTDDATIVTITVDNWVMNSSAINGNPTGSFGFYLGHQNLAGLRLRNLRLNNLSVPFLFRNPQYADYGVLIENVEIDTQRAGYAVIGKNDTATVLAPGTIVELLAGSAVGTLKVQIAAAAVGTRCGIWVTGWDDVLGTGRGFGLIAVAPPDKTTSALCNGVVAIGDVLEISGTNGQLNTNAASVRPIGRAVTQRTGAGASLVDIGPIGVA